MERPKGRFSKALGGNAADKDIKAFEKKLKTEKADAGASAGASASTKAAPAKETDTAAKSRRKPKDKGKPRPVREVVPPPLPLDGGAYDFRALPDPERTLQRVQALLSDSRLTHGERAAAALIVFQFQGMEGAQLISVKKLLTESRGYSCTIRDRLLPKLSALGLVRSQWLRGKGTEIELLF